MKKCIRKMNCNSKFRKALSCLYKKYLYKTVTKDELKSCDELIQIYESESLTKKEKRKIIEDILFYHYVYDMTLKGYYIFGFNKLPETEVENYIYYAVGIHYLNYLNDGAIEYAKNKWESYLKFRKYYNRDIMVINNLKDLERFKEFCTNHPIFIKKPINEERGRGVEKIDSSKKDLMQLLVQLLSVNGPFLIEECIIQHEQMAALHPSSVNCVRILPLVDKKGNIKIYNPVLKIGKNNSLIDNGAAGGILVAIDAKSGVTISDGIDEYRNEFEYHPNSNIKLKGYQLPHWDKLLKMIDEIYKKCEPQGRYLGWDVACTDKGWVVVEVNAKPDFAIQQLPLKKGLRKEFEKLIDWKTVVTSKQYIPKKTKKKNKSIFNRMKSKIKHNIVNFLKKRSYKSKIAKTIYSSLLYMRSYRANRKTIAKQINIYYANHTKRETKKCIKDMLYSKEEYGIVFSEYFMFKFFEKNHIERKKFIGSVDRHMYLNYLNKVSLYNQFKDKYETYMLYQKYFKREMELIKDEKDFKAFSDFCDKHKVIVKKVLDSSLGKGVELIDTVGQDLKKLFKKLLEENGAFLVEERIVQSKEMAKLHPESVNTIRVVPFYTKDKQIVVHYPFLKIGQNHSFVDNGGAGGILAAIDPETGKVISDGIDEQMTIYKKHPNTKEKIKGFQIPDWEGVQKLANKLAKENLAARYVGWDLAHTSKGWVVVEGNGKTMFVGQQMILDQGIKDELEELIDWKNVPNKEQYKKQKPNK